ncbi:PREDICTED: pathogenesis-related protein PRB1-3-like [Ipomoea nil]|uniref:pathogenesis-related protein PRB1-3-like n=1 Tax=Ipomoea nil TaxID=35883 RepID=UPI000901C3A3|nr:PREDICTED: pathogenesis-related protein PRB1-3-like [Ipomoea nil]
MSSEGQFSCPWQNANDNKKEMEFSFLQLTISIIALAAIAQTSFVQSACDSDCVKGFVAAHNAARQTVGSPPVNWNSTLADIAESYAAKRSADCVPQNSNGLYGENIAVASAELSPADSMKLWMGEKKDYDHASNSCTSGNNCRSYTQRKSDGSSAVGEEEDHRCCERESERRRERKWRGTDCFRKALLECQLAQSEAQWSMKANED